MVMAYAFFVAQDHLTAVHTVTYPFYPDFTLIFDALALIQNLLLLYY